VCVAVGSRAPSPFPDAQHIQWTQTHSRCSQLAVALGSCQGLSVAECQPPQSYRSKSMFADSITRLCAVLLFHELCKKIPCGTG
jgi:hypothetical protein